MLLKLPVLLISGLLTVRPSLKLSTWKSGLLSRCKHKTNVGASESWRYHLQSHCAYARTSLLEEEASPSARCVHLSSHFSSLSFMAAHMPLYPCVIKWDSIFPFDLKNIGPFFAVAFCFSDQAIVIVWVVMESYISLMLLTRMTRLKNTIYNFLS